MKKILFILLFFPVSIFAQIVAFDVQYRDEEKGYVAKLSAHNHIIAMVDGMTCPDFFLTTDNGVLLKDTRNCTWSYIPYRLHYGIIYFNKIVDEDTIVFHKKRLVIQPMRFRPVLPPFPSEKHEVLHLTKAEFQKARLYMMVQHRFYDKPVNLSSFQIRVERENENIYYKKITKIDYEVYMKSIKWFNNLVTDDVITLTKIKYEYPNKLGEPFIFETFDIQIVIK